MAHLEPGITEIALAPALDSDELRAIDPDAAGRTDDLDLALSDDLRRRVVHMGAIPVGYRELRAAQRERR